ncbi:MAG TPA: TPM domain-containing protein, partial [Gemmatales bacterium]|nr:TPM domain-containing protein [Gemmatales bacterium]
MSLTRQNIAVPMVLLLGWAWASSMAIASEPGVQDNARMFSSDALQNANAALSEIKSRTRQTIIVETHEGIPSNKRAAFQADREKFYANWVIERLMSNKLTGTLFLVVQETQSDVAAGGKPRLRVEYASDPATAKTLSKSEAEKLKNILGKSIVEGRANDGLQEMVAAAKATMLTHFKSASPLGEAASKGVLKPDQEARKEVLVQTKDNEPKEGMSTGTIIMYIV